MSRPGCFTRPPEHWKHLRPFNKKYFAKQERQAFRKRIERILKDGKRP